MPGEDYGIRLERDGHVAVVTFDRPQRRNAFNEKMWNDLEAATAALAADLPRAVVLTGAGERAFCAGFDVNPDNPMVGGLLESVQTHDPVPVEGMIRRVRSAVDRLTSLPVPLVAAMNGLAYGGGAEISLRCDLRVVDPKAVICFSEVRLGLMPDWGGGVALARTVGPATAADLILTARKVTAEEALRLGIVSRVSAPGKALEEALALAGTIAKNGPRAVRHCLALIRRVPDLDLDAALELETREAVALIAGGECFHGIQAFMEKRQPEFPDA